MAEKFNEKGDVLCHRAIGNGKWVVIWTDMSGGGTGHGKHDVYVDGYRLILRKLKKGTKDEIDWSVKEREYYQSEYKPHLPYIKPLRHLG